MTIQEAVVVAITNKSFITRRAWKGIVTLTPIHTAIKIQPTNTPGCCFLHNDAANEIRPGWQPRAEDLVADDWEVTVI